MSENLPFDPQELEDRKAMDRKKGDHSKSRWSYNSFCMRFECKNRDMSCHRCDNFDQYE